MVEPPAPDERIEDKAQEKHRDRVNGIAATFLVLLFAFALWVVKIFHDQEQLQRCLETRRTTCFDLKEPPRDGIRLPTH
jgi:hypothetical protein